MVNRAIQTEYDELAVKEYSEQPNTHEFENQSLSGIPNVLGSLAIDAKISEVAAENIRRVQKIDDKDATIAIDGVELPAPSAVRKNVDLYQGEINAVADFCSNLVRKINAESLSDDEKQDLGEAYNWLEESFKYITRAKMNQFIPNARIGRDDFLQIIRNRLFHTGFKNFDSEKGSFRTYYVMIAGRGLVDTISGQVTPYSTPRRIITEERREELIQLKESAFSIQGNEGGEEDLPILDDSYGIDPGLIYEKQHSITEAMDVSGLTEIEKVAIIETVLRGRTYEEIANELGKSKKTIDNAIQRAKIKLRRGLVEHGMVEGYVGTTDTAAIKAQIEAEKRSASLAALAVSPKTKAARERSAKQKVKQRATKAGQAAA